MATGASRPGPAPTRIVALGDSLTAGYGLAAPFAFPARLQAALRAEGRIVEVVNAGVSGDTSAGGKARLAWATAESPEFVIVALGANDGLRGIDPKETFTNLDAILARLKSRQIGVLLTGMYAPPNFGRRYGEEFNNVFPRLAAKHRVPFYPFFLDGVAGDAALNQADGLHPNARGVDIIVERILPHMRALLDGRG